MTAPDDLPPARRGGRSQVLRSALTCMVDRGYHGTRMRDIAAAAGTTPAAIYYHFPSKQAILLELMNDALMQARHAVDAALAASRPDPAARLHAATHAWVHFHAEHRDAAMIGASEIRSLEEPYRDDVVARRDAQESLFRSLVAAGADAGRFTTPDPALAARAIITMGTAVAAWYHPEGRLTPDELARSYADLALQLVGTPPG